VVRIVTDSTSHIPAEVARQLQISVVPMYVHFGTDVYRGGVELRPDDFCSKLIASRTFPTTSAPKLKDLSEVVLPP
jgi:fatty acid-binding protein DegV